MTVAIVGAGVAGLSAARVFAARGIETVILEAGRAHGGRARTDRPAALGGAVFDAGAVWLHDADRNPLVTLARAAGETLADAFAAGTRRIFSDGRLVAHDAMDAAWEGFERTADGLLAAGGDVALTAVADARAEDPWALTIERWEGPVIAAADAERISLRDVRRNALDGANLIPPAGLGAMVRRVLAPDPRRLRCGVRVEAVIWMRSGVRLETTAGPVEADAVVITVSTAALGRIRFDPPLPDATAAALAALPMGQVLKVALRAAGADRLGLPDSCSIVTRRVARDDVPVIANAWPRGRDHVWCWIGGANAAALERDPGAAEDVCRAYLRDLFGADADRAFARGSHRTAWAADPLTGGAYAYATPGNAGARAVLRRPVMDGRVILAGEAGVTDGLAGTLGGAFNAGREAAEGYRAATQTFSLADDSHSRRPAIRSEPSRPSP